MKLTLSLIFITIIQSFAYSFTNSPDSSGRILIYFEFYYYAITKNGDIEKIEAPQGVSKTDLYKTVCRAYFDNNKLAFQKVKDLYLANKNKIDLPSFDPNNYSVNPTAEYAMEIGKGNIGYDIHKEVYNIISGDTLTITTSDWSINFLPLIYAWSSDGHWLAIAKDDKRDDDKSGSSILIANLAKKEIIQYELGEHIEKITWNSRSNVIAVLTEEDLRARTIWNYLIPMCWIQPQNVHSFYLYTIKTNGELIRKIEIAHRIDEGGCYNIFWIE